MTLAWSRGPTGSECLYRLPRSRSPVQTAATTPSSTAYSEWWALETGVDRASNETATPAAANFPPFRIHDTREDGTLSGVCLTASPPSLSRIHNVSKRTASLDLRPVPGPGIMRPKDENVRGERWGDGSSAAEREENMQPCRPPVTARRSPPPATVGFLGTINQGGHACWSRGSRVVPCRAATRGKMPANSGHAH